MEINVFVLILWKAMTFDKALWPETRQMSLEGGTSRQKKAPGWWSGLCPVCLTLGRCGETCRISHTDTFTSEVGTLRQEVRQGHRQQTPTVISQL